MAMDHANAAATAVAAHNDRRDNLCRMMTDDVVASQSDRRC
jgi:hypothetical protein